MNNLLLKGLLYGLLVPLLGLGTCIGATGCTTDLAGKDRIGFGVRNTNEVYVFHVVELNDEQTGHATASIDLQPLLDYLIEWKASQADTASDVETVPLPE